MFHDTTFPPPDGRLAQIMRLVDDCERDTIEQAVERLIATLDARDGDADLEPTGDELDASWLEGQGGRDPMRGGAAIEDAEQDDEPEDDDSDRCAGGDDHMIGGPVAQREWWRGLCHQDEDREPDVDREEGPWEESIAQSSFLRCDHYEPNAVLADRLNQASAFPDNDA